MVFLPLVIKFHVRNENISSDGKLYLADHLITCKGVKMLPALSYVTISCALILEIFMEISTGLEGENICRNLM